jgi:DNA-directed RNA polymerase specialized sigma24 family protein
VEGRAVDTSSRDLARTLWRQLASRNHWQLITDEEVLLDDILAALPDPLIEENVERQVRLAINRLYSKRLFAGIGDREERAAYEIWLMFLRLAVKDGESEQDANDQAQEAVARVLQKLGQVRSPEGFLSWSTMVFRTTQRDLRLKPGTQSLTTENDMLVAEPADPSDLATEVENSLFTQEFRDLLRVAVPNDLERLTLLRCVVFGDDPRDVARDLGLPLYRTRVAKSRALQRLRGNNTFKAFIYSLDPSRNEAAPMTGGQNYE